MRGNFFDGRIQVMRKATFPLVLVAGAALVASGSQGCGGAGTTEAPGAGDGGFDDVPSLFGPPGSDGGPAQQPCTGGLCMQQVQCPTSGVTTTLSGTVYDPAANDPLYNVIVYVPNDPSKVGPITSGATCDQCGSVSGDPLVSALTDPAGHFQLQNIPVMDDLPVIVQIGKWRRQFKIPHVAMCTDNPVPDKMFTLPKNHGEGDIPLTAISTGDADALECVLRNMGIDEAEFTSPGGGGRIQLFMQNGATLAGGIPDASASLWNNTADLMKYDQVILDCEGAQNDKPAAAQKNLISYANAGGRVLATHFSYVWLYNDAPFSGTAQWNVAQHDPPDPLTATIDTSFPKGQAFSQWLGNVKALISPMPPEISITAPRHDVDAVNPPSTRWIYAGQNLQHYTFNTPVGVPDTMQCGRVVFSDFHVTANSGGHSGGQTFPANCDSPPLKAQEKTLEFMLFDLASCIQNDNQPPAPPPPIIK
jgi:hypothetical protein